MATLEKKQIITVNALKKLLLNVDEDCSVASGVSGELLLYKRDRLIGFIDLGENKVKMIPIQLQ